MGVVVWDEARDYDAWSVQDMGSMVLRDRNHPSVIVYSYCNEIECHQVVLL
jgi:beta-galactosidase/beta-glucuronidase